MWFSVSVFDFFLLSPQINYIHDLQLHTELQDNNMTSLLDKIITQGEEITQLKSENKQQQDKITELQTTIKDNAHFETGTTECGSSDHDFTDGDVTIPTRYNGLGTSTNFTFHTVSIPVTFSKSYPGPPLVYVALQDAYWDDDHYAWFRVDAMEVTSSGFKVRCGIYTASNQQIGDVRVRWMSLPQ